MNPPAESPDTLAAELTAMRQQLHDEQARLRSAFDKNARPGPLLRGRTRAVDRTLVKLWALCKMPKNAVLVAVGGYGRGELYPASDVDILILLAEQESQLERERIEQFISLLWDLGLDIGHSVRTLDECLREATGDVTVQTNLLESRRLIGPEKAFSQFSQSLCAEFDPQAFFHAKSAEQRQRYNRFNHTPYSLEPNSKESPGGLRDLQVIVWVSLAEGLGTRWQAMAANGLIVEEDAKELASVERFMQQVRIRLHHIAGRREDRLIFDLQEALAQSFKLRATRGRRASEVMMQRYYQAAKQITQLNTIVLQNMAQRYAGLSQSQIKPLNERFQTRNDLLDIVDDDVFEREPIALLEAFHIMQCHSHLKGMSMRTLRGLWRGRHLINSVYRRAPAHRALFMQIIQAEHGQTHELRRMNDYGILGAYLPAFGRIVGQMQHDLFHVYTVDQHILQVLRNVRRFALDEHAHEYPQMTRLFAEFDKPWVLYVAALFHDIAKGRGGDHSKLGMSDARRFCREHAIDSEDTELIVWLVEQHLTMSQVAQKFDLADPDVIRGFADLTGSERRLNALYLLTHADIRGTSPKVWNGWKAKLLDDLYSMSQALLGGKTTMQAMRSSERREEALTRLRFYGLQAGTETALWKELDPVYFMRHAGDEIAWHTRMLYHRVSSETPVVKARISQAEHGLHVMIYTPDQRDLFARLCGFFSRNSYGILDAKIYTTRHGYALDSFVLMAHADDSEYRDVIALIEHELEIELRTQPPIIEPTGGRISRQLKHFPITPSLSLQPDERGQHFILTIAAADRPGLLYTVAATLAKHGIHIHTAKIATLGERVEDTFLVSGPSLTHSSKTVQLESDLIERLRV